MPAFRVFHRTWWKENPAWPEGREPGPGRQHFVSWADTEEEAREICRAWNKAHSPGFLSDKAEYESA